jgi:acylphosphatase
MKEIEAIISGKVQGVSYRYFVKKKADNLWLKGEVENIPDFKVKVVAQGPAEKLEQFIGYLWKGPFGAKVSNVEISWREPSEEFRDFKIKF